jgi:N-acetylglucosamine-6-sulfatase
MTGVHQSDFVGQWGVQQMQKAVASDLPFFVHLTPLMIHYGVCYGPLPKGQTNAITDPFWEKNLTAWGCDNKDHKLCSFSVSPCPSTKNAHAFDSAVNPHVPNWNTSETGPLPTAMDLPPISDFTSRRMDIGFRNRSAALLDLDGLIGVVLDGIEALGVKNQTYVIFTSDNGYHLGEHSMPMGKEHPYETDVSLPMYIAGPGVPAGSILRYPTNHIDITATIVELGGATAMGPPLDGLSFAAAFSANPPAPDAWRDFQFSEHHCGELTWRKIRRPLESGPPGANNHTVRARH